MYYIYILICIGYTGIKGLISCIDFNPDRSGVYAVGSYSNSMGIYAEGSPSCVLEITKLDCSISNIKWSKDGCYLWAAGRSNQHILCWDVRYTRQEVGRVYRDGSSNQRIGFDIDPWNEYVVTGGRQGK